MMLLDLDFPYSKILLCGAILSTAQVYLVKRAAPHELFRGVVRFPCFHLKVLELELVDVIEGASKGVASNSLILRFRSSSYAATFLVSMTWVISLSSGRRALIAFLSELHRVEQVLFDRIVSSFQ
jgi:hypothetical protein